MPVEAARNPDETSAAAADDRQPQETVPELANTVEFESETSGSKPGGLEEADTSRNEDAVYESRLTDSEPRLSQSLARPAAVQQRRRGGSEPRNGKSTLPPLASTSTVQVRDRDAAADDDAIRRSRPRQRGLRQLRLPPLQDVSGAGGEQAAGKPGRKQRRDGKAASGPASVTSPGRDTAREKLTQRSTASPDDNDARRSRDASKSGTKSDGQPRRGSPALKTDENCNIITEDVPTVDQEDVKDATARGKDTARSEGKAKSVDAAETARSEKDRKRHHRGADDVKMKTKMERQVQCYFT